MKQLFILILLSIMAFGRFDAKPSQECEAFNNMKHTKNTHHVMLDLKTSYTVLKEHKGQNLILIKGEQPSQRWVDGSCFSKIAKKTNHDDVSTAQSQVISINQPANSSKKSNNKISKQNLLALSWQNAFCETHQYKKECKNTSAYNEKHFVLHGLWPQPRNNLYCKVSKKEIGKDKNKQWNRLSDLDLSAKTRKELQVVMPGYSSNLHKHEWIKHGTCYGTDANRYYADAIALITQVNQSKVGDFFAKNIGKHVTLKAVRQAFDASFGAGAGKHVELRCKSGLITEIWLHLGTGSDTLKSSLLAGKKVKSRCQRGLIDKAGF